MGDNWVRLDPTLRVVTHLDGVGSFPVHPGGLEDPVGTLDDRRLFADVTDDWARTVLGFGLADALGAAATLIREQFAALGTHWPVRSTPSIGDELTLIEAAVTAAASDLASFESAALGGIGETGSGRSGGTPADHLGPAYIMTRRPLPQPRSERRCSRSVGVRSLRVAAQPT